MAVVTPTSTNGMFHNLKFSIGFREFVTGVHRDRYASHIGHFSRLAYMSVAENEPIAKTRFKLLEVSLPFPNQMVN